MQVTEYIPGFIESDHDEEVAEVTTLAELHEMTFVKLWAAKDGFTRFEASLPQKRGSGMLFAVLHNKAWPIGFVAGGSLVELGVPRWIRPANISPFSPFPFPQEG